MINNKTVVVFLPTTNAAKVFESHSIKSLIYA